MTRIVRAGMLSALLSFSIMSANAADFCVNSSASLQAALDTAASNNESDIIRITIGNYSSPPGGFDFTPQGSANLDDDLELSGGWAPFFQQPCVLNSADPSMTVLDGGGVEPVMQVLLPSLGDVDVRFLTFANGSAAPKDAPAGLSMRNPTAYAGRLTVSNNVFSNNSAAQASGLLVAVFAGSGLNVQVLNNSFIGNSAVWGEFAAGTIFGLVAPDQLDLGSANEAEALTFAHNSVVGNQSVGAAGGFSLFTNSLDLNIASNNLWGNSGDDLVLEATGDVQNLRLLNNNIQALRLEGATTPTLSQDNINVQPVYVDCGPGCLDLIPVVQSPLVNSGLAPTSLGLPWMLPPTDAAGQPRQDGAAIDIGAFEARETVFSDRFEN